MFERGTDYPTAVASHDNTAVEEAIEWSLQHMGDDDTLTVWTHLVSGLRNSAPLAELVRRYSNVEHATGRGHSYVRNGPVIMAWPDISDIGEVINARITSLCVITWNADSIRPWVSAVNPVVLGDGSNWETTTPTSTR